MIDGFKIEMTADELIEHLDTRIQHHRTAASECDAKRIRLEAVGISTDDENDAPFVGCWPGYGAELEHRAEQHKRKETTLTFLRDHIVARELYRLGEEDLRLLEVWPRRTAIDVDR